jgi:hypothetical protein
MTTEEGVISWIRKFQEQPIPSGLVLFVFDIHDASLPSWAARHTPLPLPENYPHNRTIARSYPYPTQLESVLPDVLAGDTVLLLDGTFRRNP